MARPKKTVVDNMADITEDTEALVDPKETPEATKEDTHTLPLEERPKGVPYAILGTDMTRVDY